MEEKVKLWREVRSVDAPLPVGHTELGLSELSMRVRVGRNLEQFNLPGAMAKDERIAFEKTMLDVSRRRRRLGGPESQKLSTERRKARMVCAQARARWSATGVLDISAKMASASLLSISSLVSTRRAR